MNIARGSPGRLRSTRRVVRRNSSGVAIFRPCRRAGREILRVYRYDAERMPGRSFHDHVPANPRFYSSAEFREAGDFGFDISRLRCIDSSSPFSSVAEVSVLYARIAQHDDQNRIVTMNLASPGPTFSEELIVSSVESSSRNLPMPRWIASIGSTRISSALRPSDGFHVASPRFI